MQLTDPTHGTSEPTRYWSTANIGEATPDVLSPMCWSFWGPTMEAAARLAYADLGILPGDELEVPKDHNQLLTAHFYGRPAMNLDRLRTLFNAIPGMTADDFERDICGEVRQSLPPEPKAGRTGQVLTRAPLAMATAGRKVRKLAVDQRAWWERMVLDRDENADPRLLLRDSAPRFREAFRAHVRGRFVLMAIQAQLTKTAEAAGRGDLVVRLMAGLGGVSETEMADDLWLVGRGLLPIEEFIRRHGFHGPNEGNVAATSWREDDSPVRQLAEAMAARPDDQRPRVREAATVNERPEAIGELAAALPRAKRAGARWLCRLAGRAVLTNEVGKGSFLMALDGGRAATRAIGRELHDAGVLEDTDDAFFLTMDELLATGPGGSAELGKLIQFRRERRDEYRHYELPQTFTGMPVPIELKPHDGPDDVVIAGVAGAPGTAQGRARVVVDPATGAIEPGEILVCRFTDPSWAPIFTLADALVIDIGAAASHGAIVARELGVPCVIGTGDGSRRIRTGDLLRVDGSAGRVEILGRAGTTAEAGTAREAKAVARGAADGAA